jgi:hypothetical protein
MQWSTVSFPVREYEFFLAFGLKASFYAPWDNGISISHTERIRIAPLVITESLPIRVQSLNF